MPVVSPEIVTVRAGAAIDAAADHVTALSVDTSTYEVSSSAPPLLDGFDHDKYAVVPALERNPLKYLGAVGTVFAKGTAVAATEGALSPAAFIATTRT